MKKMHISELSRQAGLSHATIRLYETHGLITPARDQSVPDEHREYDAGVLERLHVVARVNGYGFTPTETAAFLEMHENRQNQGIIGYRYRGGMADEHLAG